MRNLNLVLSVIICFTSSFDCEGQNGCYNGRFESIESRADSLKKKQQFKEAIGERLVINNIDNTCTSNLFELSALYSLNRNYDSAFFFLSKATDRDSNIDFLVNPDYIFICKDDRWRVIQNNQILKYESIHGQFKNLSLITLLWDMKMKDQSYYVFMDYSKQEEVNKYWQIKDSINKINLYLLDSIIRQSGWPKSSEVGNQGSVVAFLIIQHAEYAVQKKYFHYLKNAVKQNEAYPKDLALLTDRIRLHKKKKQIYGSQIDWDPVTQRDFFNYSTLKNPPKVNKRRKKVGLGPIEEYVKIWDITWEYKK